MKNKKILLLLLILVCIFSSFNVAKAVQFPTLTEITHENIEAHNYNKTYYPDLRGTTMTVTMYAYINPAFGSGVGDNPNLPNPFNVHHSYLDTGTQTFYTGYFYNNDEGQYNAYIMYCSGYRVPVHTGVQAPNQTKVYDWKYEEMSDATKNLVSLALIYGFDSDKAVASSGPAAALIVRNDPNGTGGFVKGHVRENYATQLTVWLASTGFIGTEEQDKILRHFCEIDGELDDGIYELTKSYCDKVMKALKMPSYAATSEAAAPTYEMKWDPIDQRFEYTLTDANGLGNAEKVDITFETGNSGINVEKNGDTVTLWSKTAIGTKNAPLTLKVRKDINGGTGVAGFWQSYTANNGNPSQPMTRLLGIPREPEYAYVKVFAESLAIRVEKKNVSTSGNLGDSILSGAVFGIYSDANCTQEIARITTDANGNAQSPILSVNKCYVKEIVAPIGTNINPNVYEASVATAVPQADGTLLFTIKLNNTIKEGNIKVVKKLQATDNDPEIYLAGAQFKATLNSNPNQVYYSNVSGNDGVCTINNIPYGVYTISECKTPASALTIENFQVNVDTHGKTYEYTKIDPSKKMKIEIEKVLLEEIRGKTDAKVSGAYFTVYTDAACTKPFMNKRNLPVVIGPTDVNGYAVSGTMRTGTYYLKETTFPEGINPDAKVPGEDVTFRNKVYTASANNMDQTKEVVTIHVGPITNISKMGSVDAIKYDDEKEATEESSAKGAVLRLTLDSNPNCYYETTLNKNGYGEFINQDLIEYYPYTIPYGVYTITEVRASDSGLHTKYHIDAKQVIIKNHEEPSHNIFSDYDIEMFLEIQKVDKDTGEKVKIAGAKFKVWDCEKEQFVSQRVYPEEKFTEEFVTNSEGRLTLPHKLEAGKYIVYETESPNGYYLEDKWRVPEEKDLGNEEVAGKAVTIDDEALGIEGDLANRDVELFYEVEMEDRPLKGKIEVYKTGEMLTDSSQEDTKYGTKYTPVYTVQGLPGVTYEIYVAKDIVSPDGNVVYKTAGTFVGEMTTDEYGYALSEELYLGEYKLIETVTPEGFITDTDIPNVIIKNEDKTERVNITKVPLNNIRQKLKLTFPKEYVEVNYSSSKDLDKYAIFGVYANQDIKNIEGTIVIGKDSLVDIITIKGDATEGTSTIDLPKGLYYVQEIETAYPYTVSEEKINIELAHSGHTNEYVTKEGEKFVNTFDGATVTLIKVSSSSLQNVVIDGAEIDVENMDVQLNQMIEDIKGMTEDEIRNYLESKDIKCVSGAVYNIYVDEACTDPLLVKDEATGEFAPAKLITNKTGIIKIENLPIGQYYLKETIAPAGYEKSEQIIPISLTREDKDTTVYNALVDDDIVYPMLTKTDIFTGEAIPNCMFEITDENGKIIQHSRTDADGRGYIPVNALENGKTYYYREIEAPGIYDLITEPHEFVADYTITEDGEVIWNNPVKVENRRKTIDELIVRKVDDETGEPLQGCKFSIILIDEEGNPVLNPDGENVYLVKEAVTGENGEYIVEKPYFGIYQFIEVEAPEGYEMKVDMEGMVFEINADSPETIIFEVTNTGDIAVYALTALAVVSVLGIAFVIVRHRKQRA